VAEPVLQDRDNNELTNHSSPPAPLQCKPSATLRGVAGSRTNGSPSTNILALQHQGIL
jgi:hypothetical protein